MTTSPILGLTELAAAQAIPETNVNERGRWWEFFATGGAIEDRDLATPPGSPADGDCYLIDASATGAWAGHDGEIAMYLSTAWAFVPAVEGMQLYVKDEDVRIIYDGSSWTTPAGSSGGLSLPAGGTDGQVLTKQSATDGDADWETPSAGGSGTAWTLAGSWVQATNGNVTTVEVDVSAYDEALIVVDRVTAASGLARTIRVSTDGGSSYYSGSTSYQQINSAGATTDFNALAISAVTGSARTITAHIRNLKGAVKSASTTNTPAEMVFVASASPITNIQAASGGATMNGGAIYVYGR